MEKEQNTGRKDASKLIKGIALAGLVAGTALTSGCLTYAEPEKPDYHYTRPGEVSYDIFKATNPRLYNKPFFISY